MNMKQNEPALLVLQSTQRTTDQIVSAAKAYANIRWRFEDKLLKTLLLAQITFTNRRYTNQEPGRLY